jgi:hypothetical protein
MVHVNNPDGLYPAGLSDTDLRKERAAGAEAPETSADLLTEKQVLGAVEKLTHYLREQRSRFYPIGQPLEPKNKTFLARFFDPSLLGQMKVVKMSGARVPNPPFFETAKQMGFKNLPDLKHQSTVTFLDVVVFNEQFTERALFHGLVHATQAQVLGIERFAELFLRGFLRSKSYFMVPLKAHAFSLDCQFAEHRERGFSVETEVTRWLEQGRY